MIQGQECSAKLRVRVNNDLTLDAGICEGPSGPDGEEVFIRPPEKTLFRQKRASSSTRSIRTMDDRHAMLSVISPMSPRPEARISVLLYG